MPTDEPRTMPKTKETRESNPRRTSQPAQSTTRPYRGEGFEFFLIRSYNLYFFTVIDYLFLIILMNFVCTFYIYFFIYRMCYAPQRCGDGL